MSIQTLMNPANGKILPQFIDNAVVTKSSSFMTLPIMGIITSANTTFPQQTPLITPINPATTNPIFVLSNVQVPAEMLSRQYLYLDTELSVNFTAITGGLGNYLSTCTGVCQPAGGTGPYTVIQVAHLNLVSQVGAVSNAKGVVTLYSNTITANKIMIKFSEIYNMSEAIANHINWALPFDIVLFGASTGAIAGGINVGVNMQSKLTFNKVGP